MPINKTYTSNTLYNDSTGVIAFAEQLKQELINWANYEHVTEKLGPDNRPDTQNQLNNLFLRVYEEFLTFLNNADATDEAINTWKEIENFLADYTDEKTLASIVAELNSKIESRLTVPLESTTGSSITSTMTQKAITETIDASKTFTTGEKVDNVGIDAKPTAGSDNLVKSDGVQNELYNEIYTPVALDEYLEGYIKYNGNIESNTNWKTYCIPCTAGDKFKIIFSLYNSTTARPYAIYNTDDTTQIGSSTVITYGSLVPSSTQNLQLTIPINDSSAKYLCITSRDGICTLSSVSKVTYISKFTALEIAGVNSMIASRDWRISGNVVYDSNEIPVSYNITWADGTSSTVVMSNFNDNVFEYTTVTATYKTQTVVYTLTYNENGYLISETYNIQ